MNTIREFIVEQMTDPVDGRAFIESYLDVQDKHLDKLERLARAARQVAKWEDFSELFMDISRWHSRDATNYARARKELSAALQALDKR